jgi:mono/diheme cytochrome c family protein
MMKSTLVPMALFTSIALSLPAEAQSADPSVGLHLAETVCSACHQVGAAPSPQNSKSGAPTFVAISRMPSMNELAIKVFMRTSHPPMPNIILSKEESDSVAAYIVNLTKDRTDGHKE